MVGGDTLAYMLTFGSVVVGIFALIFLFYTNSFLLKRRKKRIWRFNILGMEKSHLAKTIAWENFYVMIISIAGGLILGIALDKAMYLLLAQLIEVEIRLGFFISGKAILTTIFLFLTIFFLIFLNAVRQVRMSNPIDLLNAGNVGEKEPKTKIVTAMLGVVFGRNGLLSCPDHHKSGYCNSSVSCGSHAGNHRHIYAVHRGEYRTFEST